MRLSETREEDVETRSRSVEEWRYHIKVGFVELLVAYQSFLDFLYCRLIHQCLKREFHSHKIEGSSKFLTF